MTKEINMLKSQLRNCSTKQNEEIQTTQFDMASFKEASEEKLYELRRNMSGKCPKYTRWY